MSADASAVQISFHPSVHMGQYVFTVVIGRDVPRIRSSPLTRSWREFRVDWVDWVDTKRFSRTEDSLDSLDSLRSDISQTRSSIQVWWSGLRGYLERFAPQSFDSNREMQLRGLWIRASLDFGDQWIVAGCWKWFDSTLVLLLVVILVEWWSKKHVKQCFSLLNSDY